MKPAINKSLIPLYRPRIGKEEISVVKRVLESRKLTRGKEVKIFEQQFAAYNKKKYAVAVNSGTSGLHLAVRALGWKKGDEVITTAFSFIASANALLFEGVRPVFVDIDPRTLNIDVKKIEKKITKNTKGILLVHVLGLPVESEAVLKLKKKYNLKIIEDACEAIGRPDNDFKTTKLGDFSVYSFHENKQLTSGGEGGMIVTDNHLLAQKCYSMREQGRSDKKNWIDNVILGFNYRMTEMQAAMGGAQLKFLKKNLKKREKAAKKYSSLLARVKGVITPESLSDKKRSWFAYFVIFADPADRNLAHDALAKAGISSSLIYFPPIYKFPMYRNYRIGDYPNTEYVSRRLLTLPLFYEISGQQIIKIVKIIKKSLNQ